MEQGLLGEFETFARAEIDRGGESPRPRYGLATVHAIRGERSEAMWWLREAVAMGWRYEWLLARDPLLDGLRDEPEFQRLLAEVRAEIERQRRVVEREGL